MLGPRDLDPAAPAQRTPRAVAEAFIQAIDEGDLGAAGRMLAPGCECRDGVLAVTGSDAVLALYRESINWAQRGFDDVRNVSTIAGVDGARVSVGVTAMMMRMPGRWHRLRFRRELTIDANGRITAIVQECDPAGASAFRAFVRDCNVPPPPPGFGA